MTPVRDGRRCLPAHQPPPNCPRDAARSPKGLYLLGERRRSLGLGPKPHNALRSPTLLPIYPGAVLVDFLNLAPTAEADLVRDAGDGWSTTPRTWSETAVSNQTEFLTTPHSFGGLFAELEHCRLPVVVWTRASIPRP